MSPRHSLPPPPASVGRGRLVTWLRPDFPERKMEIKGHLGNVISGNFCGKKATSEDFSEGNKRCVSISHDLAALRLASATALFMALLLRARSLRRC